MRKSTVFNRFVLVALLSSYLFSCSQEDDPQAKQEAPAVPPAATLEMELYSFSEEDASNGRATAEGYWNVVHARVGFIVWNSIIKLQLAVPTIALAEAFKHQPTLVEAGKWRWTYDVEIDGNYQVTLYGSDQKNEQVGWELYLSKKGGFQDFLWVEGTSARNGTQGQWMVNTATSELMKVDWKKGDSDTVTELTYTHVEKDSEYKGSYVKYQALDEGDYNTSYSVYLSNEDNLFKINYNTETLVGQVSDPKRFKDEAWHCWNGDFEDVSCE
ncbi:MAG: hypothetical protein WA960_16240 [Tunicatimonas sp.]